jgi:hypothetical protein
MEFEEELKQISEKSNLLQQHLAPIIDQWVLLKIRKSACIFDHSDNNRINEIDQLEDYYIHLIHQLLGYSHSDNGINLI